MTPRKPSEKGPRRTRLPEAMYHDDEAALVRKVAGHSISDFIRTAVIDKARKEDGKRHPKPKRTP